MTILSQLGACKVREVWAWNFETELAQLLAAAAKGSIIIALDTEFPGCIHEVPQHASPTVQHQVLCSNVDVLQPIQIGIALAIDGVHRGVWNFNLKFDLTTDRYTEDSISFLRLAGINFARHATEGLDPWMFGARLSGSGLFSTAGPGPILITFSGSYDLAYLVKLLTAEPLPQDPNCFKSVLGKLCSGHHDIRDYLPYGSLQSLLEEHKVQRSGIAHTAGSDALATLELFACVVPDLCIASPQKATVEETSSVWRKAARIAMLGANAKATKAIELAAPSFGPLPDEDWSNRPQVGAHGSVAWIDATRKASPQVFQEKVSQEAKHRATSNATRIDEWITVAVKSVGLPRHQQFLPPPGLLPPEAIGLSALGA